ncbi:2-succinylbenzoate--CoA ligase [Pelotomaculum schinkii]|uniref:2-succinylbenzoate--CoA ligase n=1 Tax=Pelotomaculum schinkii TaxID=78350 RepID=A0A4Y7R8M3_9FIRM|nr:o-succinylbenzoate--CoA ligase [Pelotomaculum schinkii]TEB05314.1 2-succinylbenzoate--CoA ligase [Pelotomaculum schinkii]
MNWLEKQSIEKPDKKFFNSLTFKEVYERVTDLAKRLYLYVKNQRRVALYSNNSVDVALFFLALQVMQIEVLMLNTRLTDEEITEQLKTLNIKVVFSQNKKFISFQEVYQSDQKQDIKLAGEFNPEQIAVIMNTSATTGKFKSVPLRWKQFYAHVEASQKSVGINEEDNWLMVLPMYHISGLTILLRSLYNGTAVTIVDKFNEEQVLKLIGDAAINMLSIVPTMLNRIIDRIERHNLRVVLVGGEFIPEPLVEKCLRKNIPIYKTYGMTETTSQSVTFCVFNYPEKIDSVGVPLEEVRISIKNPDEDGAGEVLIKSPMLMDGYLGMETISGFFNTEDIGYLDEDGFLYILDRRENIIISGGENIYPQEIENILYAHSEIFECAVIGMEDKKWGQVPVLFVVSSLNEDAIYKYLVKKIAKYKLPQKIVYLDELPKNPSGKILKKDLLKRYYVD